MILLMPGVCNQIREGGHVTGPFCFIFTSFLNLYLIYLLLDQVNLNRTSVTNCNYFLKELFHLS